ncbi:MAG: pyridoxal phosphate-dependent aminotransferase [Spirochaetia bacterium]|nr:pyridoxal phosphate-dependent aminotransferase [Spirochaetia bacterium]
MGYDFSFIDRKDTDCLKFDFTRERGHRDDCLSYWVADMDFKTAPEILESVHERVNHGIFGYTNIKDHYYETVAAWMKRHHGYEVRRKWLIETPGVVFALATAIKAYSKAGDAVLIQTPVYYPFKNVVLKNDRRLVTSPLVWEKDGGGFGNYSVDYDDFESKIVENNVKLFFLCNPHNPGGKSWKKGELSKIAEICLRYNVIVVSDEIHSDFVWKPNTHTVFASLSKDVEKITVTCTSPSKSFNLAGLQVSNIFVADEKLRKAFWLERDRTGYDEPNVLGLIACEAAYDRGEKWFFEAYDFINSNMDFAVDYINTKSNGLLRCRKPDATYLLWIDCSALPYDDVELNRRIVEDANLWLDPGNIFGREGEMFQRINVATSREYLEKGLKALVENLLKP